MDTAGEDNGGGAYQQAGVDIDHANDLLDNVKSKLGRATRSEMLPSIGAFGGLFQLELSQYTRPVLVSSIDGVGTKLMVGQMAGRYRRLGFDLVNHCINDVIVQGAEPLYFLDYLGTGQLHAEVYEAVLGGLADACSEQNVALLGGETAEMPGMYGQHFDLVGAITGVVEKETLITGQTVARDNVLLGLASNGLHTNGFSLAREVLFDQAGLSVHETVPQLGESVGEALLAEHRCYWPAVRAVLSECGHAVTGMAHITGGGLYDNVARIIPEGLQAGCQPDALPVPPILTLIAEKGRVPTAEMYRVFNMGVGMVMTLSASAADQAASLCEQAGFTVARIGRVRERPSGQPAVHLHGVEPGE